MTHLRFKTDPTNSWNKLFNTRVLNDVLENVLNAQSQDSETVVPSVNIMETKDAFQLYVAAPGLQKEDFKINLEKEVLTISSDKQAKELAEGVNYTRKEFSFYSFKRSFNLPLSADLESIAAEYVNGVLQVSIAKKIIAKETVKEIKIS